MHIRSDSLRRERVSTFRESFNVLPGLSSYPSVGVYALGEREREGGMSSFLSFLAREWRPTSLFGRLLRPQQFFFQQSTLPPLARPLDLRRPVVVVADGCDEAGADVDPEVAKEVEALRRIFDHFDENKDGRISREELRRSLHMFDIAVDDAELAAMIDGADRNSDGHLDFGEFASFYYSLHEEASSATGRGLAQSQGGDQREQGGAADDRELREAFSVFDKNGDGFICAEELQCVLARMGLSPHARELSSCRAMIRKVDVDGDGQVSFDEFKQMMIVSLGQS